MSSIKTVVRISVAVLFLYSPCNKAYAQRVKGYYITNNGDTISCHIKMPKEAHLGVKAINVTDSADDEVSFAPFEIKSFAFSDKRSDHLFYSKSALDSSSLFVEALVEGKNTNIYYYDLEDLTRSKWDKYRLPGKVGDIKPSYFQIFIFEIKDRGRFFLSVDSYARNSDLESVKSKLKYFYKGQSEIMDLISERFQNRNKLREDIKSLANAINEM